MSFSRCTNCILRSKVNPQLHGIDLDKVIPRVSKSLGIYFNVVLRMAQCKSQAVVDRELSTLQAE